ncbi:hypothetical protein [Streptantibioticus silvisoli]|uniref:Uncharacterized protein n=1 Tax=Streptantibioticus silvisoli TaxID=2705255 RepID=A0ABT6VSM5_9ACTN|nr:hypothetical protein [Streptantibioticus silvisoli]MDI5961475.1 hypothetical protein [Streptantibioticus silvisoli]
MDKVRALLAIPPKGEDGDYDRARIGDLLEQVTSKKLDIPPADEVRRELNGGVDLRSDMTVAEWLEVFLTNNPPPGSRTSVTASAQRASCGHRSASGAGGRPAKFRARSWCGVRNRTRQNELRLTCGDAWKNTGKVFTQEDGPG